MALKCILSRPASYWRTQGLNRLNRLNGDRTLWKNMTWYSPTPHLPPPEIPSVNNRILDKDWNNVRCRTLHTLINQTRSQMFLIPNNFVATIPQKLCNGLICTVSTRNISMAMWQCRCGLKERNSTSRSQTKSLPLSSWIKFSPLQDFSHWGAGKKLPH